MHTLKKICVHLNQSVITVRVFGDANVILCYVLLIASHLKYDVIDFGVIHASNLLTNLVLFFSILDEI